jgi:peptidoglycan/LPS O-acetylase OafA/YrhL
VARTPGRRATGNAAFRGDVEGLRALAVVLVLVFHAAPGVLPGGFVGVDVFFVISGFLITGLLVAELEETGRISLLGFYARRAKRVLPAAAVVLGASLLLTVWFLPEIRWSDTARDVTASGLYAVNWVLADRAADYLTADQAPSIVQHYWSLAVEEQFYLLWPLLLVGIGAWVARRGRAGRRRAWLLLGVTAVAIPSLAWSIHLTRTEPDAAFFVTTTRLWELALGGGLAILDDRVARLSRRLAGGLAWAGLAAILTAAFALDPAAAPGYVALLPTLGTVAVIAGGPRAGRTGPAVVLDRPPVRAVGAASYSLYLWHWPVLVAAQARLGDLSTPAALAVVGLSAVPAVLTYRYVENPIRFARALRSNPGPALRIGAACTAASVLGGFVFSAVLVPRIPPGGDDPELATSPGAAARTAPGAAALGPMPRGAAAGVAVDEVATVVPNPLAARKDVPATYRNGCHDLDDPARACVLGETGATFTIAIVGDSHAAQWIPALETIAAANHWRVISYTKPGCIFLYTDRPLAGVDETCVAWNAGLRPLLTGRERPNLLLVSGASRVLGSERPAIVQATRRALSEVAAGATVVLLRDTPWPGIDVAECVATHRHRLTRCAIARDKAVVQVGRAWRLAQDEAVAGLARVNLVDLTDAICPADPCAAVIGGVIVYHDAHHLTATYARSLAPRLREAIERALQ